MSIRKDRALTDRNRTPDRAALEAGQRKKWVKPDLKVISAGSAELNVGHIDDSFDVS